MILRVDHMGILVRSLAEALRANENLAPLLRRAREQGCRTMNRLGMLLQQAVLNFQRWTHGCPGFADAKRSPAGTRGTGAERLANSTE
jgi:hypothetical protein